MTTKHKDLQETAILRLYEFGCSIFAKEVPTQNGVADALGIKTLHGKDDVYYLECKASRSDLICKKQKQVYQNAIGAVIKRCYIHTFRGFDGKIQAGWESCRECKKLADGQGDTGIDFYYLVVANGIKVEDSLYPAFGVINESGVIVRKAKRMKRHPEREVKELMIAVAHVLVYKAYGKIYIGEHA